MFFLIGQETSDTPVLYVGLTKQAQVGVMFLMIQKRHNAVGRIFELSILVYLHSINMDAQQIALLRLRIVFFIILTSILQYLFVFETLLAL